MLAPLCFCLSLACHRLVINAYYIRRILLPCANHEFDRPFTVCVGRLICGALANLKIKVSTHSMHIHYDLSRWRQERTIRSLFHRQSCWDMKLRMGFLPESNINTWKQNMFSLVRTTPWSFNNISTQEEQKQRGGICSYCRCRFRCGHRE